MSPAYKLTSASVLSVLLLAACSPTPPAPTPGPAATPATDTAAAPADVAPAPVVAPGMHALTPADLVPRTASADSCNIEAAGNTPFGPTPTEITEKSTTISGWFLSGMSKKTGIPASLQFLNADGNGGAQIRIDHWTQRPDVTLERGAKDAGGTGFIQPVELGELPAGQYQVSIVFQEGGQPYYCEQGRMIVLK
jgi:hypothetical protein